MLGQLQMQPLGFARLPAYKDISSHRLRPFSKPETFFPFEGCVPALPMDGEGVRVTGYNGGKFRLMSALTKNLANPLVNSSIFAISRVGFEEDCIDQL
jgi:hypothetical protein